MSDEMEVIVPDDPFDLDISAVPEQEREVKAVPSGKYLFEIVSYAAATNPNKGTRGIEYGLRLVSALEDQDIEGIPVDMINFNHVFWVTRPSAPVVLSIHRRLNPSVVGTIKDFPEQMVGVRVVGELETITEDENGERLQWPRYRVQKLTPST